MDVERAELIYPGKLANVLKEIKRMRVGIMRWQKHAGIKRGLSKQSSQKVREEINTKYFSQKGNRDGDEWV